LIINTVRVKGQGTSGLSSFISAPTLKRSFSLLLLYISLNVRFEKFAIHQDNIPTKSIAVVPVTVMLLAGHYIKNGNEKFLDVCSRSINMEWLSW